MFQELPKRISTEEESEILALLCKVHELEIEKVMLVQRFSERSSFWKFCFLFFLLHRWRCSRTR